MKNKSPSPNMMRENVNIMNKMQNTDIMNKEVKI
jgi:hypothetical protein